MDLADFAGTPSYLAYELKHAMQERSSGNATEGLVRLFKCDMVSLGLMVFNMARLCMTGQFNNHIDAMEKQEEELQIMIYSEDFKDLLRLMLTLDPQERPDFIQLLEKLKTMNIEPVLLNSDWHEVSPAPSQRPVDLADEDEVPTEVIDYIPGSSFGNSNDGETVNSAVGPSPPSAPSQTLVEPAEEADGPTQVVDYMFGGSNDGTTFNSYAGYAPSPAYDSVTGPPVHDTQEHVTNLTVGQSKSYITLAKTGEMVHSNPDGWCVCQALGNKTNTVEERRHFTITEVESGWVHIYQNDLNVYANKYKYCGIARIGESTNTDEDRRRFRMTEVEEGVYEFTLENGQKLQQAAWNWLRCQQSPALGYRRFKITEVETDIEWFEISTVAGNETLYTNNYQWVAVAPNSTSTNTDDLRRKFRLVRYEDDTVQFALLNGQTIYAENSKEVATAYPGKHNNKNPDRSRFRMKEVERGIFEFVLPNGQTMYTTPKGWISVAQVGQSTNTEERRRRYTFIRV